MPDTGPLNEYFIVDIDKTGEHTVLSTGYAALPHCALFAPDPLHSDTLYYFAKDAHTGTWTLEANHTFAEEEGLELYITALAVSSKFIYATIGTARSFMSSPWLTVL